MAFNVDLLAGDIEALARANDVAGLETAVDTLCTLVESGAVAPTPAQSRRALGALRGKRQFALLIKLAEALRGCDLADLTAQRLEAQALIDLNRGDEALPVLEKIVRTAPDGETEWREAQGLIGRVWKQSYVDAQQGAAGSGDPATLQKAIIAYARVVERGEFVRDHWHFVNFVALTARAERDGVYPNHTESSRNLAELLAGLLVARVDSPDADIWMLASLGESYVALGRLAEAKVIYERYMKGAGTDAFELFSSMRQLIEVWGLKRGDGTGGEIIAMLEARIAELMARQVTLTAADVMRLERLSGASSTLEPVAGIAGEVTEQARDGQSEGSDIPPLSLLTLDLLLRVVDRATSVGRIKNRFEGRHVGSGFLVRGEELHEALGRDVFLLTNSHVVGRLPGASLKPRNIEIELKDRHGRVASLTARDEDVVWESRVDHLDATLLRLRDVPAGFEPAPLCRPDAFPDDYGLLPEDERVFFIAGAMGDLQHSVNLAPSRILDLGWRDAARRDHIYLHHDAPARDGTSGSPLFSREWRVIALHRAGTEQNSMLPALSGRAGDRVAKLAVTINAIRRGIARDLAAPSSVDEALPFMQDVELLELLKEERVDEEVLAQYVEWDEAHSRPFEPVLRRRPNADGTVPENAFSDAWWTTVATAASIGFRARRNRGFGRRPGDGRGLTFVSEGDSWFQFPVPGIADTIDHLRQTHSVFCHAVAGSELRAAAARAHERILPSIAQNKPDGVLLSGGGNDLLGFDAIDLHVSTFKEGASAEAHILPTLENTLNVLVGYYETLIEEILATDPKLKIFCHGYDWALPSEPGGRWLYRPLSVARKIKDVGLQQKIVKELINRFNDRLSGLEAKYRGHVFHVDCRGSIGATRQAWYDELHPRSAGFGRVAGRFNRRIAEAYAGDERVIGIA